MLSEVLAAHSDSLARQLQEQAELDLHTASHEAVELAVTSDSLERDDINARFCSFVIYKMDINDIS